MIASAPAPVAPEAAAPHVLDAAFAALDAAGIAWCLLRDGDVHEPGGDVDLLVDRGSIDRAASTLREAGFVELPSLGRGSHRFFRALDRVSGAWIDLDVVTELAYGPHFSLKTGAEAACLARSWRPGRFPTVQPEDGFWGLLLHCLLDKRAFPERHARRLQELAPGAGTRAPLARAVARFAPGSCSPARLRAAAAAGD
jgi:hypothetical protein